MRARHLGLLGVALIASSVWGCLRQDQAGAAGDLANGHFVDEVRIDNPGTDAESAAVAGVGGSNGATFTQSAAQGGGGGGAAVGADKTCGYPDLGEIHLAVPSSRPLASPALARGFIDAGRGPDPALVRAQEFFNYYQVRYDQKSPELTVVANVTAGEVPNEVVLQVGVQAPAERHRALALVVVVDTSLSMAGESMRRARKAVESLAQALEPGDSFTLVTSSLAAASPTIAINNPSDAAKAASIAQSLEADGGELLGAALSEAYLIAEEKKPSTKLARVVLITDGAARADLIDLGVVAGNQQLREIPLIGVGVGSATEYESELVDVASRVGGGASVYLDSADEAPLMLRDRFDQLMDVWADDVELVVTLPMGVRVKYVPTAIPSDSPTGALHTTLPLGRTIVLRQVLESCKDFKNLVNESTIGVYARWRPRGEDTYKTTADVGGTIGQLGLGSPDSVQVQKASFIAAYADALANLRAAQLQNIHEQISTLQSSMETPPELANDKDLGEISRLAEKLVNAAKP